MKEFWVARVESFQEFASYAEHMTGGVDWRSPIERSIIPPKNEHLDVDGYCGVCERPSRFRVDYQYAHLMPEGSLLPNIRERMACEHCGLNTRMRATIHFMKQRASVIKHNDIYVTEQVTPMFDALVARFDRVTGSEYLGENLPLGANNDVGVRNEDGTALTFSDNSFDTIVSLDVLEHIPNYKKALSEFVRCLKPGGQLVLTVPFNLESYENIERAKFIDGRLEHILTPEYHGDPLNQDGVLCFRHFGWCILDDLKESGFHRAEICFYWSKEFGYLGGWPFLIWASV